MQVISKDQIETNNLTKSGLNCFIMQTQSPLRWLHPTLLYQEIPNHPVSSSEVLWRLMEGSTCLATVVTQVNQIGWLEHANRFIILNKRVILRYK